MAAQEAIKEQFSVPWLAKKPAGATPLAGNTPSSSPAPSSSKPAKATIGIPVAAEPMQPATPEPVAVPAEPATTEAATSGSTAERVALLECDDVGPSASSSSSVSAVIQPASEAGTATPAETSAAGETVAPSTTTPETPKTAGPTGDSESPSTPSATQVPKPRVLTQAHFAFALKNSSSSGSEELGALPELRKWNEQFGDAGTKKNKRSGFGKGFGFGEREVKKKS